MSRLRKIEAYTMKAQYNPQLFGTQSKDLALMSQWVIAVVNHSRNQMAVHKQNLKTKGTRPKRNDLRPKYVTPDVPTNQI